MRLDSATTTETAATRATTAPPLRRLSEDDAWAIAMKWQPQLQGHVRLVVDRDGPVDSILKSYAWVDISLLRAVAYVSADEPRRRDALSVTRAVMVSWAALAACPGYSGAQNPLFWKRVVGALQPSVEEEPARQRGMRHGPSGARYRPKPLRPQPQRITDAHGFFNCPGHSFPRFAVGMPSAMDDAFLDLLTPDGPDLTPAVHDTLAVVLARLDTVYRPSVTAQACIDMRLSIHIKSPYTTADSDALSALMAAAQTPRGAPASPHFRVCQLRIDGHFQLVGPEHINGFLQLAQAVPLSIGHFHFIPLLNDVSSDDRARWLFAFLRLEGHGVQAAARSFSLTRHDVNDAVFQSLMSALPFATSTHSLALDTDRNERKGTFEKTDLPWIAYAIFHPRAASSSWRHLELDNLTLTEHSARVLSAMARGNNLLALLNGTTPDSEAYYRARLMAGTVVQSKPRWTVLIVMLELPQRGDAVLTVPPEGMIVDVCGIRSLDPTTWDKWVAVVVPAYGLGWVRVTDLHDVQAHAPARRSLTGLRLRPVRATSQATMEDRPEAVLRVLRPLRDMLTYLDVSEYTDMEATTLRELLRVCRSLRSLTVSHAGDFWTSNAEERDHDVALATQLIELELRVHVAHARVVPPMPSFLTTSLRHLRVLRFRVWETSPDQLSASRITLALLLRHAPALRYVHWRNKDAVDGMRTMTTYEQRLGSTSEALRTLQLTELARHFSTRHHDVNALTPTQAAAFLSVVVPKRTAHRMGALADRGVMATILGFAASPRFICIEPTHENELDDAIARELQMLMQPHRDRFR